MTRSPSSFRLVLLSVRTAAGILKRLRGCSPHPNLSGEGQESQLTTTSSTIIKLRVWPRHSSWGSECHKIQAACTVLSSLRKSKYQASTRTTELPKTMASQPPTLANDFMKLFSKSKASWQNSTTERPGGEHPKARRPLTLRSPPTGWGSEYLHMDSQKAISARGTTEHHCAYIS